jgi:nucleoid-associated protein YgaU
LTIPAENGALSAAKQTGPRNVAADPQPATIYPAPRPLPIAAQEPRRSSPSAVPLDDRPAPPPELPKDYPGGVPGAAVQQWSAFASPAGSRRGTSAGEVLPVAVSSSRKHKIVDGDTLPALAERYLGSASRASEIYDANRAVLADPNILRIDVELTIPGGEP